jgi:hypothetical protein
MNGDELAVGVALGLAATLELGDAAADGDDEVTTGPDVVGGRRSGLLATRMPTISAAMTAAATPAIQKLSRAGGACPIDERTRSRRVGLGAPPIRSNAVFRSRRKLSLLISEHFLEVDVGTEPFGGAVDARLGRGHRNAERPRHLVDWQVEVEEQDQR